MNDLLLIEIMGLFQNHAFYIESNAPSRQRVIAACGLRLAACGWRLAACGWRLAAGGLRLAAGGLRGGVTRHR